MESLPAAHLAGLTPKHIDVKFYDDRMEEIPFDEVTDLVAISIETYTAKRAYQIATEYRRRNIPVVMGGFHATLVPDEVAEYAETVVVGEAESIWKDVINDFESGQLKRVYRSEKRPDISKVIPDRSILSGKRYLPIGLVEAARGCTFKCDFCVIQTYFDSTQNRKEIQTILDEIRSISDKRKLIFFVDDNIVSHPKQAKEFYRALIPLKIRWVSQAAITMTHDDEMLQILKESGCQGVLIGFESLNHENLLKMNKSFNGTKGGIEAAVKKMNAYGIRLYATFIFGYENDTIDSFREAVEFCIKHKIFMAAFNHLTPFPGTPLYKRLEEEGKLLYRKWWLADEYRYGQVPFRTVLDPELIRTECVKARKSFYSFTSIWRRMFSKTNSSSFFMLHAFLFINLLLRKEASLRDLYPLGDLSFQGELLKVKEPINALSKNP
ncbi:B12-binding domain-containing radical SAM protein [Leptospira brenneri]|uniref:Radical SAM protein n=1 Tax=Leptospira brenneri TaxID=2023182 RepID=A0A2M9XWW2_9LEPT|nr:radical SAM protein [Leptospira brenneri]PJZ43835.1 B12-binding domain-containing radical SAM protein [Leptospira brenneri]TGK92410.1 radical SAM protein [Leptospira brenneri]